MNARARARDEARIGGSPSVDLRPPSIAARQRDQSKLAWSLLIFVLAMLMIGVVASVTATRRSLAEADLGSTQAQLLSIIQTEGTYSDVREIELDSALLDRAAAIATRSEVAWADVVRELLAVAPEGATVGRIDAFTPGVAEDPLAPVSPLRHPRIGSLTLVVAVQEVSQVATYARAIEALAFIADVSIDSVIDGLGTLTVNLSDVALTGRFADGIDGSGLQESTIGDAEIGVAP